MIPCGVSSHSGSPHSQKNPASSRHSDASSTSPFPPSTSSSDALAAAHLMESQTALPRSQAPRPTTLHEVPQISTDTRPLAAAGGIMIGSHHPAPMRWACSDESQAAPATSCQPPHAAKPTEPPPAMPDITGSRGCEGWQAVAAEQPLTHLQECGLHPALLAEVRLDHSLESS